MQKQKTTMVTMRERSATAERNWSELPEEILHLFSKKLPDISDFIRFRAVCKSWQLSAPVTDPPPQLPWLLELRSREQRESTIIRFYCLSSDKVHTISCPGSHLAFLKGPAFRYLLAYHLRSFEMHLINPLTHDQIPVPFVNLCASPDYIGPDPIQGDDIVVIISGDPEDPMEQNEPPKVMAFWRPMAEYWNYIEGVGDSGNTFYMGQYFGNDLETGVTTVHDIATEKLVYQVAPPEGTDPLDEGCTILVESGGKILRLFQYYEDDQCHFDIYRLYFGDGKGKPCWVKITDIGDQILFLQHYRGLSFCASNFAGFKGNCIYFLKDKQYLCRYDIGDGTTEVLPCPFDSLETWFVPSLV
ncbi:putative F-box/kelch-repeat protein At5g24040 [Carex rostrata]